MNNLKTVLNGFSGFLLFFCLFSPDVQAQQWDTLAGMSVTPAAVNSTTIQFKNNIPYVAFRGGYTGTESCLLKYENALWDTVGTATMTAGTETDQHFAFDNNGVPHIAYVSAANSGKVMVIKYDGTEWLSVGSLTTDDNAYDPYLLFDNNNDIYLAYSYTDMAIIFLPKPKAELFHFSGGTWTQKGPTLEGQFATLAMDASNKLYLAYNHSSGLASLDGLKMKMYNSGLDVFDDMGMDTVSGMATSIVIVADSMDLYVAYSDSLNSDKLSLLKYDGSYWNYVGAAGFSGGAVTSISMVVENGIPYLAFDDAGNASKATVMMYDSSTWSTFGAAGISAGAAEDISLRVDNGTFYTSYRDNGLSGSLAVMKYYISVNTQKIQSVSNSLTLYPNPVSDLISVDTDLLIERLSVINMDGKMIKSTDDYSISVRDLPQGIYILEVITDEGKGYKQFVRK